MRKTARINDFAARLALGFFFVLEAAAPGCADGGGDAMEKACHTDQDCPEPARQTCVRQWGICVGQTNELGAIDAGTD